MPGQAREQHSGMTFFHRNDNFLIDPSTALRSGRDEFLRIILQFWGVKCKIVEIVGCERQDNREGVIC